MDENETVKAPTVDERYTKALELLSNGDRDVVDEYVAAKDAEIERLMQNVRIASQMLTDTWELVQSIQISTKNITKTLMPILRSQQERQPRRG